MGPYRSNMPQRVLGVVTCKYGSLAAYQFIFLSGCFPLVLSEYGSRKKPTRHMIARNCSFPIRIRVRTLVAPRACSSGSPRLHPQPHSTAPRPPPPPGPLLPDSHVPCPPSSSPGLVCPLARCLLTAEARAHVDTSSPSPPGSEPVSVQHNGCTPSLWPSC